MASWSPEYVRRVRRDSIEIDLLRLGKVIATTTIEDESREAEGMRYLSRWLPQPDNGVRCPQGVTFALSKSTSLHIKFHRNQNKEKEIENVQEEFKICTARPGITFSHFLGSSPD